MEDIIEKYTESIKETKEYQRLIELKREIDEKYFLRIIGMKTKEAYYQEALERPEVYDLKKAQRELSEAKAKLYSEPLVQEYFEVERKLNEMLKEDMQALKDSISPHFEHSGVCHGKE